MRSHDGSDTTYAGYRRFQVAGCRPIAGRQRSAPLEIKGSQLMHKVIFAAALAVGLIAAPMSQLISSAAAQQQVEHRQECKNRKRPERWSARDARAAEEVRGGVEGSEGRQQNRERNDLAKILERLQQASQVCFQVTCSLYFKARTQNRTHKMTEGIGETEISPTPSVSSEPGRPG